jgi:hypothetical protein
LEVINGMALFHDLLSRDPADSAAGIGRSGVGSSTDGKLAVVCDGHFDNGRHAGRRPNGNSVIVDVAAFASCTMDSAIEDLFIFSSKVLDAQRGARSSGLIGTIRLNGEPIDLNDLHRTVNVMQVRDRHSAAFCDLICRLKLAGWTKMGVIEKAPREPFMQNGRPAALA